ncbi:VOC family protein [Novosphingobium sp. BL-52-GroH]|uniref:VOC family protein n=1 Tax=Novosphingobium sp. BL-52-GroH TaxID=3349877 RepID=UPI00384E9049
MTDGAGSPAGKHLSRPRIRGVLTMFYYENLAEATRWYTDVMGFEHVLRLDGAEIFRVEDNAHLALVAEGKGSQPVIPGRGKGVLLSIQTDDLEAWHERLFALGVEGTGKGAHVGAGGTTIEFKVYDPGGYTIEFFEWIE